VLKIKAGVSYYDMLIYGFYQRVGCAITPFGSLTSFNLRGLYGGTNMTTFSFKAVEANIPEIFEEAV
jgi:hypothetical protein